MRQFPLSFEFNEHFLCTLAYHHMSMRFRTFAMDSEHERHEAGWWNEDEERPRGKSLWEYLERCHRKSPTFYNFLYSPGQLKVSAIRLTLSPSKTSNLTTHTILKTHIFRTRSEKDSPILMCLIDLCYIPMKITIYHHF